MLQTLSIKNYVIIDALTIDFGEGLNILTGETGAGKSIIIYALGLILGDRANTSIIRKNADSCELTAVFNIKNMSKIKKLLNSTGIPSDDDNLIFKREITADGKTKCFINGTFSTLRMLQTIGDELVDIHGQNEHQSLLNIENQREMLDNYGDVAELSLEIKSIFERFTTLKNQLNDLKNSEKDRLQKLDLYRYQLKEIESAKLSETDENDLEKEYTRLTNAEKLFNLSRDIYSLLYDSDGSAVENLGKAKKLIENLSMIDNSNNEESENISKILEETKTISDTFRAYKDNIEFNPDRLEEVINKIELIKNLKKKYAPNLKELLEYADYIRKQIFFFERADENIEKMEKELKNIGSKLKKLSLELSEKRMITAKKLSKEIERELSELGMAKSKFFIIVERETNFEGDYNFNSHGIDNIEFEISTNVGEELQPLKMVASGGEMSRMMLAIKTVLAKADKTPTLIFDEIDAGLSGPMGQIIGKKLKILSKNHQILSITHLPQLAAFSATHFYISKYVDDDKTITSVLKLDENKKIAEISRMLGGEKSTDTSLKHAKELVKQAK